MSRSKMAYIWSADIIVSRGEIDGLLFYEVRTTANVTYDETDTFSDEMIQSAGREWLAEELDVDPDAITFLNYSWCGLDPIPTDSASAAF